MAIDDFSQVVDKTSMEVWKMIPFLNTQHAGTVL